MTPGEVDEIKIINKQLDEEQSAGAVARAVSLLTSDENKTPKAPQTIFDLIAQDPEANKRRELENAERCAIKNIINKNIRII